MTRRASAALLVAWLLATPRWSAAQSNVGAVRVHGVAFDSLRNAPLDGATVTVIGTTLRTVTDSAGRFRFDSVPAGTQTFAAQHAALDSIGFTGITTRATLSTGSADIRIAVPSFATLWHAACGSPSRPPRDSGFIYGMIRSAATGQPLPNATVTVTWLDLSVGRTRTVRHTTWRGQSRSDASGNYGICGVPTAIGLRIRASTDSAESGLIDVPGAGRRVQRRDLSVVAVSDSGVAGLGTIAGVVTDSTGTPVANARVIADGAWEIRSAPDGRFALLTAAGTRQLEVLGIGMLPVVTIVDVPVRDTVTVPVSVRRVTTLDVVRVTAAPYVRRLIQAFDERRRDGSGYTMDSTAIAGRGTLAAMFHSAPGVEVEYLGTASQFVVTFPGRARPGGNARCVANLIIDGRRAEFDEFLVMRPHEIAALEVYPRALSAPQQFIKDTSCGALVVWSKWLFNEAAPR